MKLIKKDYGVLFKAYNSATKEYLELEISRIYSYMSRRLEDGQKPLFQIKQSDVSWQDEAEWRVVGDFDFSNIKED